MFGGTPNFFSYLALLLFLPIAFLSFLFFRPIVATTWLMLGAMLYLPERVEVDPPVLPPINKQSIAALCIFIGCLVRAWARVKQAKPLRGVDFSFVLAAIGFVITNLQNSDPQVFGPTYLPGTTLYDAFAGNIKDALVIYLPFLIGRAMYRSAADLRTFLQILCASLILYAPLIFWELRMSPRCHYDVYGFMQTDFQMTLRGGGYRPMVFMNGGLALAMFVLSAGVAALALYRSKERIPVPGIAKLRAGPVSSFFALLVVLMKSTGAIVYAVVCMPLLAFMRKPRMRLALFLAILVLAYPLLRATKLFPTELIVSVAEEFSKERALSIWFRFFNEDQLLERAAQRRWFGWSGYGRFRVYDPSTGEDLSVTDGAWIIDLGSRGIWGFACYYGMLVYPIFVAFRRLRSIPEISDRWLVAGMGLIVALNATDLLPNGLFNYFPYYFSGVLMGVLEGKRWTIRAHEEKMLRHEARKQSRMKVKWAVPSPSGAA